MAHRPTVLLVHDDIDARVRFGNWLSAGGYRCVTAEDSASALRFAGRMPFDVAVIDIGRRETDRLRLAGRLRGRTSPMGVVLVSRGRSSDRADAARIGVPDLLVSPSHPEPLLAAVEQAARWRESEEARLLGAWSAAVAAVAARQAELKRAVRGAGSAQEMLAAIRQTFRGGEPALFGHGERVARSAITIGRALHLSVSEVADLEAAALLHDAGKLALPEDVLLGQTPVGDLEMEALLDHQSRTLDLLGDGPFAGAARLIESLYECWDGTGGPQGLAGRAIPFGARILAVADVSDEARARCLRVDHETQQAVVQTALLFEGGKRLDPDLVRVSLHASDGQLCS